eukprot:5342353-Karenia_brevis.AAC.1
MKLAAADDTAEKVAIHDLDKWEAVPFLPISPEHQAIQQELTRAGKTLNDTCTLEDSARYGKPIVAAKVMDSRPRPLLEASARQGFHTLPLSFLGKLGAHIGVDVAGLKLRDCLLTLWPRCIPGCTDALLLELLTIR